jgi:hypothetical protein
MEEIFRGRLKLLSQHLLRGLEENHDKHQSEWPESGDPSPPK